MRQSSGVLFGIVLVTFLAMGCSSGKTVTRVDPDTTIYLSGYWNDTDSRLVSDEMIADALSANWYTNYMQAEGDRPTVIVGTVRNKSSEHIAVSTFIGDIERAFVNSGTRVLCPAA